jgi:CheY-like chemotaxis protein
MNLSKIATQNFNSSDYTILIVDDNPTNLGVIADYLETYGFEIMIARDGGDALEKAQLLPPDLIWVCFK